MKIKSRTFVGINRYLSQAHLDAKEQLDDWINNSTALPSDKKFNDFKIAESFSLGPTKNWVFVISIYFEEK